MTAQQPGASIFPPAGTCPCTPARFVYLLNGWRHHDGELCPSVPTEGGQS